MGTEETIAIDILQTEHGLVSNGIESDNVYDLLKNVVDTPHQVAIVDNEHFELYQKLYQ